MEMYKLRSSVSVVDLGNNQLEFFKTNVRKSIKIHTNGDLIKKIVTSLDGNTSIEELGKKYNFDPSSGYAIQLITFIKRKAIIANDSLVKNRDDYKQYRRVIHFLEDYSDSDESLLDMWENIRNARVLIIGLGAVGSWVAVNLVQSGVKNLALMDNDIVDISNLHRQYGYFEDDIGKKKTTVLKNHLMEMEPRCVIDEYNFFLTEDSLSKINGPIDLVVNCADKPSVDTTSKWVGKYCMEKRIPHIVGGGYNMHLSLIGQTIIPYKTACVNCFSRQLDETNNLQGVDIKRLNIKNRKIGSFGPMCSIVASMTAMEAIKVLSKHISPDNVNRRGEFDIYTMKLKYFDFEKLDDCEWCGEQ